MIWDTPVILPPFKLKSLQVIVPSPLVQSILSTIKVGHLIVSPKPSTCIAYCGLFIFTPIRLYCVSITTTSLVVVDGILSVNVWIVLIQPYRSQ